MTTPENKLTITNPEANSTPNPNKIPEWSDDIEKVLDNIRINAFNLSEKHRKRFLYLKNIANYFDIPIIIISAANTIISVGVQGFINQKTISITNCILSSVCGIIVSIKLYLAIQNQMEIELATSKDFYNLSVEIYKTISLNVENREVDGMNFLNTCFHTYTDLMQKSNVLNKNIKDKMVPVKIPLSINLENKKVLSSLHSLPNLLDNHSSKSQESIVEINSSVDIENGLNSTSSKNEIPFIYNTSNNENS